MTNPRTAAPVDRPRRVIFWTFTSSPAAILFLWLERTGRQRFWAAIATEGASVAVGVGSAQSVRVVD